MAKKKGRRETIVNNLLTGSLVRLSAAEPEELVKAYMVWDRDSEFRRLLDDIPPRLWSKEKYEAWIKLSIDKADNKAYQFHLRTLEGNRLIGFIEVWCESWIHREGFIGIGIGSRSDWGKGYGTDAMKCILRFSFLELNLRRVSLDTFSYNPRAIRSYEKAGFIHEGRQRGIISKDGQRYDMLYLGILRDEWERRKDH
jgi:RimJ/RimL family protein N-acetyltransferase